jgi:hypothetical protein
MALADATLTIGATAIRDSITHFQLHSASPGAAGTTAAVGTRVANTGAVDGDGDITWSTINFTGLTANQGVTHVTAWSAITGGTYRGQWALSGDLAANAAGEYTVTSITETSTAS